MGVGESFFVYGFRLVVVLRLLVQCNLIAQSFCRSSLKRERRVYALVILVTCVRLSIGKVLMPLRLIR